MGDSRPTEPPPGRAIAIERKAADWLARREGGGAWAEADAQALEAWLAEDVVHRVAFLRLDAAWRESGRLQALGASWRRPGPPPRGYASSPAPHAAPVDIPPPRARNASPRRPRLRRWLAAAALAGAAVAGWSWWNLHVIDAATYDSAPGLVRRLPLSDGSRATLASDSRIEVRLSRRERRIALQAGEAIFDVAKDAARPFVVDAGAGRVVAVGTRFSVRRDPDGLQVVVTEGRVRLEPARGRGGVRRRAPRAGRAPPPPGRGGPPPAPGPAGARPVTLLPAGSIALVGEDGVLVRTVPIAEAEEMLGWHSGQLVFRDATLDEAAARFADCSARRLVIGDDTVAALRIGGSFRCDNVEGFARLLEQAFAVRAEHRADGIVLHAR